MCRKIKKLAWCTDEDLLEQKLDYRFLEMLVLLESKGDLSDRLKKAGMTKYSDSFLDRLRPLLQTPNKYLARYLKKTFHPELEEQMSPEMAAFCRVAQEQSETPLRTESRSQSPPMLKDEGWTMVTPVPHIRCPCHPRRPRTPVVTEEEKTAAERQTVDLFYQMQTMHIKRERELRYSMERFLPNYQRVAPRELPPPRPSSVPSMWGSGMTRAVLRNIDAIERLSTPSKRLPFPSPSHAAACYAYRPSTAMTEGLGEVRGTTPKRARKLRRRKAK